MRPNRNLTALLLIAASFWMPPLLGTQPETLPAMAGPGNGPVKAEIEETVTTEGDQALDISDYIRAESWFAGRLKATASKDSGRAYLEIGLGEAILFQGRLKEAARQLKRAESSLQYSNRKPVLEGRLYDALAWLYQGQGNLNAAREACQRAVALRRKAAVEAGSYAQDMFIASLTHLGYLQERGGSLGAAAKSFEEALALQLKGNGPGSLGAADIKERLAAVYRRQGNNDRAQKLFGEALAVKLATGANLKPYAPSQNWERVTFRYLNGAPNSMMRTESGAEEELITANGVTVSCSLSPQQVEGAKCLKVDVGMRNDSNASVAFLPVNPEFISMEPRVTIAPQVDPAKLAQTVAKKGERKASWIKFWGADATMPVTTTFIGNPGFWGHPPVVTSGVMPPIINRDRRGNVTTITQHVPDYAAQARALERAAAVTERTRQQADTILSAGLGPTVVPPGRSLRGSLYFDVTRVTSAVVKLPVGNSTYEYRFPGK